MGPSISKAPPAAKGCPVAAPAEVVDQVKAAAAEDSLNRCSFEPTDSFTSVGVVSEIEMVSWTRT